MPTAAGLYYFAHQADRLTRPPVILIHGAGGNHLYWPPQIRRLPDQRVLAVDLPGHGKSEGLGCHTIQEYTDKIVEFINALKFNSVVLVGHSMGSAVALSLAIRFPKRVIGLGLIGGGAKLRVAPSILQNASNPSTFDEAVRMITDFSFAPQTNKRLKELAARRMAETRSPVLYGDFLACDAFNVMDQLSKISAPALMICGDKDQMTPPKYSEFLCSHIAGARMEVISNAGHMVMLEQPEKTAGILDDFLNTISYQPGQ
jgi:pimeloyl-ACP methyl ester carboxylesterase